MHNITLSKEAHREEELMRVCAYRLDIQTDIFAKTFDHVSQVHAKRQLACYMDNEYKLTSSTQTQGKGVHDVQTSVLNVRYVSCHQDPLASVY